MNMATRTKIKPPLGTSVSYSEIVRDSFVAKVGWTPLASAWPVAYYVLYRDGEELATSLTATTYRDTSVVEDNSYVYTVATVNTHLFEGPLGSEAGLLVPAYPVWDTFALSMNQSASFDVAISASDPQDRSLSFSRQGGNAPAAVTVNSSGTVSSGAAAGGVYSLGIRADNGELFTDFSASLTVIATALPAVPINAGASGTTLTNIRVSWTSGSGGPAPTEYRIYRSGTETGTFTLRNTVFAPTFLLDDDVPSGATRWYKVTAFAAGLESAQTVAVSGTGQDIGSGTLFFNDGFESGTILRTGASNWDENFTSGASATVATAGGGYNGSTFYLRTQLIAASNNYRAEQHMRFANGEKTGSITTLGTPFYYGMSVRLPADFVNDVLTGDELSQFHHGSTGSGGGGGHYSLQVDFDRWKLFRQSGSDPMGEGGDLGPIANDKGVWVRWIFRWVWSKTGAGSYKVWKNATAESDTPTLQSSNITTVSANNNTIAKWTCGLYKPQWRDNNFANNYNPNLNPNVSPRVFHSDYYRMATTFDLVK